MLAAPRVSRDIDVVHDTEEALIAKGAERTVLQWARDSAYRFFPLIVDETMGLTLHPFDLATNKVLALAGRLEVRDWVDVLNCDRQIQPLLAASMRQHYSQAEVNTLEFDGHAPDAGRLGQQWHTAQEEASSVIGLLPPEMVGTCVGIDSSDLFRGNPEALKEALKEDRVTFHTGTIGGSWPTVKT